MSDVSTQQAGFTITRLLDAPPETVWTAWTDPAELARWHHPRGVSTPRDTITVDLREGGAYAYTMVHDETGERFPTAGVYLEVAPPERLRFTWASPGDPVESAPVATVTLAARGEHGQQTELTFHLSGVPGAPGDGDVHDGWDEALTHLAEHVGVGDVSTSAPPRA